MAPHMTPGLYEVQARVEQLLEAQDFNGLLEFLRSQHPADIADLLELLNESQRVEIFQLLQVDVAAEVLDETLTEITRELVEAIPAQQVADLLDVMPMDDAAEILSELPEDRADDILELMEPEEAAEVEALLAYPEETAGRLMTTDVARLDATWTVAEALDYMRNIDTEVETLSYLYAINGNGQLVGVVPIWRMLTSPPTRRIKDIMEPDVISVSVYTDQEEVARVVSQYDFFAIPVVDPDDRLLGIITHDDVIDILQEEFTEDVQRFGGSVPLEHTYLSTSIPAMVRKRVGWLLLLFLTATLTGAVMQLFERELQAAVALTVFIPLLIGTGGNAGYQITATMIRAVATGEVRFSDVWTVMAREFLTGLLLGVIMGSAGLGMALFWRLPLELGLTVAAALVALVLWANMMGVLLPIIAARLRVDPAVISGPVMSTLVDATGLLIYFSLARVIMGL